MSSKPNELQIIVFTSTLYTQDKKKLKAQTYFQYLWGTLSKNKRPTSVEDSFLPYHAAGVGYALGLGFTSISLTFLTKMASGSCLKKQHTHTDPVKREF